MKKGTLLILVYTMAIGALVVSVKLVQVVVNHSHIAHETLLADCGDPLPDDSPGE